MERCRARDYGLEFGDLPVGTQNAITDVPGVKVGHCSTWKGDGELHIGHGPIRTGITAIVPAPDDLFTSKVQAAVHFINGFGKSMGLMQIAEVGTIETPILITNTLNVGRVADGLLDYLIRDKGLRAPSINPVVLECNDYFLSDIWGRHLAKAEVVEALESAAGGRVQEGSIGAGTGTAAYGYKGGVGTSSRLISFEKNRFVLGALVVTNMGRKEQLVIKGVPAGKLLQEYDPPRELGGSIIFILATDAPLSVNQLRRLAVRATHGLARTGASSNHTSGDVVVAFSTARRIPAAADQPVITLPELVEQTFIDSFFIAAADAVEEAILNAMFMAETVIGRDGNTLQALPLRKVRELLQARGVIN
ncbi:MAG: S58 family peptidase [Candidatus Abyssobacteria bacterium SURF_5]|uniref:S58 family peptidase n=1 Tax=Abyssobacteria bacterium (strain SURF_5) TaxID=2093360 RepID=A0A3A4PAB7_ABYX5|nr:MAG: S58 family peptidase [Candidatus Abyssubacteria bacterium SURF_5]